MERYESFLLACRLVLSAFLVVVVVWASISDARACSCRALTLESRFETSANVFTAVVTTESSESADTRTPVRSQFRVTESFKGGTPFETFISDPYDGCGIDLQEGSEYLFFAPDSGEIHHCSGISGIDRAGPDIAELRSYVSGKSSSLSEPWRFSEYVSGECSLRTFFDFDDGFGQGHLSVLASNERADWARDDSRFDFVELTIHLMDRFPVAIGAPNPLKLRVGSVEYSADWTTGRTFDQSVPDGSTVKARLSDAYLMLGNDVEGLLRMLTLSDDLLVRFDGQGFEPNSDVLVRTANLANAGSEMQECMSALRASEAASDAEISAQENVFADAEQNTLTDSESIELLLQEYEREFAGESRDPEWSSGVEARILTEVSQMAGLAANLIEVECRATLCRVAFILSSPSDQRPERRVLGPDIGWGWELALAKRVGLEDKHVFWTVTVPSQVEFLTYLRRR